MKAIIPAGGLGSRLLPFTKNLSKLILPIGNKQVAHFLVEECLAAGMTKIIISGRKLEEVEEYFKENKVLRKEVRKKSPENEHLLSVPKANITFVKQDKPLGFFYELSCLPEKEKRGDFALLYSDIIAFPPTAPLQELLKEYKKGMHILLKGKVGGRLIFSSSFWKFLPELVRFENDDRAFQWFKEKTGEQSKVIHEDAVSKLFHVGTPKDYMKTIQEYHEQENRNTNRV